jgi:hypothetical protein
VLGCGDGKNGGDDHDEHARGWKVDRVKTVQGVVDRMMPVGVPLSGSSLADVSSSG